MRKVSKSLIDGSFSHDVQIITDEEVKSIVRENCVKNINNQKAIDVKLPCKKIKT